MGLIAIPTQYWLSTAFPSSTGIISNSAVATLDAAGESAFMVGTVRLESGRGTSKTVSSAGAKVFWRAHGSITVNNAATRLRVGFQDVDVNFMEDGTFDCYAELTNASGLDVNTIYGTAMTTGSKTITDGNDYAIGLEMTARGGADSVQVSGVLAQSQANVGYPLRTQDTGSGPTKGSSWLLISFVTDDGTLGWIEGAAFNGYPHLTGTALLGTTSSTPDEFGALFQVPVPVTISAFALQLAGLTLVSDDAELAFYTDPLGTPTIPTGGSVSINALAKWSGNANPAMGWFGITQQTLQANTPYAITIRPTGTANLGMQYNNLGSGNSALKSIGVPFVADSISVIGRSDQSGAFSVIDVNYLPLFGIGVDGLHDGSGGGTNIFRQHASGHLRR